MSIQQQVSRAIRILRGNRDVSARASHLVVQQDQLMTYESVLVGQAEMEKFSKSTFSERKIMSTKTSIKRIAAVAAVALTLGGFSAVSASAASTALTSGNAIIFAWTGDGLAAGDNGVSKYDATNKLGLASGTGVAGVVNTVTTKIQFDAGEGTANTAYADATGVKRAVITVSGAGATIASGGTVNTAGTQTVIAANNSATDLVINTPTAGTVTVSVFTESAQASGIFSATAAETVTWTINAAAASGVFSAANSAVYDTTTVANAATANLTTAPLKIKTANAAAVVRYDVTLKDTLSAAMASTTSYTVTISGPGLLAYGSGVSSSAGGGTNGLVRAFTTTYAYPTFYLFGDGSTGATTITVSQGTTVVATKSAAFYTGTVSKITPTVVNAIVPISSSAPAGFTAASAPQITLVTADSSGNNNTAAQNASADANVKATSSNTAVIASASVRAYDSVNAVLPVTLTAGATEGTATITFTDVATGLVTATAVVSTSAAVAATVTFTTDAATYASGDKVTYSITAKDAAGNLIPDGLYVGFLSSSAVVSTQQVTSTLLGAAGQAATSSAAGTLQFVNGVASATLYAPAAPFALNATTGTSASLATAVQGLALTTGSVAVTNAAADAAQAAIDAAQEATDAANAAYDAANNAMDSADAATAAAQDASDNASAALAAVTSLSATVAKLVKSVAAIAAALAKVQKKIGA